MPIYEYSCENCGRNTDIKHGFNETPDSACPSCGGGPLKRVFSAAGIVFKGSGFYINDSRKSSEPKKTESTSGGTTGGTSSGSGTTGGATSGSGTTGGGTSGGGTTGGGGTGGTGGSSTAAA